MRRLISYAVGALAVAGLLLIGSFGIARSSDGLRGVANQVPTEAAIRELDIEFYEQRIARDPRSAGDYARLAGLYLQRARESADDRDLLRAETTARRSLSLRSGRNSAGFGVLASSLMGQHRFVEALEVEERLLADDSTSIAARGLLAETHLELGHYEEGGRMLGSLSSYRNNPGVASRLARWEELQGRPARARHLLRAARDDAARGHGIPKEQVAWFHLRVADLALRHGRFSEAERELRSGLAIAPTDHRLLGTLARLEANRNRWDRTIEAAERALAVALEPATLGILSDAYAAKGDRARSAAYARAMQVAISRDPGPFHREWGLFLLDHDREVAAVLARAREELKTRKDIYGYDLLAWALYKSGRQVEAREASTRALALGIRDPSLLYHAGMIERSLGNDLAARAHLQAALQANPRWHPFLPAAARMTLDSIASEAKP